MSRAPFLLTILALSCAAPALDEASVTSAQRASPGSLDPIDHLRFIASPETAGRATPSAGLDRALEYVVRECEGAGLKGGIAEDVYEQPFPIGAQTGTNVVAVLPGSGAHRDEVVMLSAHLDHLGPGFLGADDNGSGSAALVAIANRLAASQPSRPLDRSVAFLWTTGEERGLLGSKYFTDHPPPSLPLEKIVQVVNLDAIGALETTRFSVLPDGAANTEAASTLIEAASREVTPPFTRINHDLQAYAQRTDAYSFVRHGVPAIWVSEGLTNPEGGGSLMPRYHKRTDTVENLIAENGGEKLRRMTTMLTSAIEKIADAPLPGR